MHPFVAIDFETANEKRGSACSVGLAKFDAAGQLVDRCYQLLRPHPDLDLSLIHNLTLPTTPYV